MAESNFDSIDQDYAEIVVVRHGETSWNAERKIQGHLDVELNDVGRQQAARVAERLSQEPKVSYVYSSDLKRALVTAEIIAAKCGVLEVNQRFKDMLIILCYESAPELSLPISFHNLNLKAQ